MASTVPTCPSCSPPEAPRASGEIRALIVALVTLITMVAEITFGLLSGSMALLADGIHMGTHALALTVTIIAYALVRRWRSHRGFAFGPGKVGVLGAYTNALLLGATALAMIVESIERMVHPLAIVFDTALFVAVLGLVVNLISAFVLGADHHHEHEHEHEHHHHEDSNLKAALAHVLADALTSVLAIGALITAKLAGWNWLDPAVGLLGAGLILSWAWGLLRSSGATLLDFGSSDEEREGVSRVVRETGAEVVDLHIWPYREGERALLVSIDPHQARVSARQIRSSLAKAGWSFDHVTIEVMDEHELG